MEFSGFEDHVKRFLNFQAFYFLSRMVPLQNFSQAGIFFMQK